MTSPGVSLGGVMPLASADTMNAPWELDFKYRLVTLACDFFDTCRIMEIIHASSTGKQAPNEPPKFPPTVIDFLNHLDAVGAFPKRPNAYLVARILERMASIGMLLSVRHHNQFDVLSSGYMYTTSTFEFDERRCDFLLVPVLGSEFLYQLCAPSLVHIAGSKCGEAVSGTGFVVDPYHVLTCKHVVSDMIVDDEQVFQGRKYIWSEGVVKAHDDVDIAVIKVNHPTLIPPQGAMFRAPIVTQTVYTLGYPKIPFLKDAAVVIQRGTVTNEAVTSFKNESLFIYSAIARPGNSGGPVISDDGYIVGLCTQDLTGEYGPASAFSPHYAGIPAGVIVKAVSELGLEIPFLMENRR